MPLSPDTAARLVLAAQVGVMAAGALAVAAFLIDPFGEPEVEVKVTSRLRPQAPPKEAAARSTHAHTDWTALVPAISWIAPDYTAPAIVSAPPEPEDDVTSGPRPGGPQAPAPGFETLGNVRYVGFLRERDRLVGLLSVEYRQRFIREGDTLNDFTVAQVHPTHVVLRSGASEHRLEITNPAPTSLMQKLAPIPPAIKGDPRIPDIRTQQRDDLADRERRIREAAAEQSGERPS